MGGIRFILNNDLMGRADNAASRIARNLANTAALAGATSGVSIVKKSVYDKILPSAYMGGNGEAVLSTSNEISPYKTSDNRYPVCNNLIFETNDKSLKIEIWDVQIDVSFENTIVKTPVTKRRGTIKEYVNAKDYSFSVSGSLIADSQYAFPIDELRQFIELTKIEENFNVTNIFINAYGVHKVVLESGSNPQSSKKYVNAMPFNLKLISDEDVELTIEQEG